jgi:hypothetical protein
METPDAQTFYCHGHLYRGPRFCSNRTIVELCAGIELNVVFNGWWLADAL